MEDINAAIRTGSVAEDVVVETRPQLSIVTAPAPVSRILVVDDEPSIRNLINTILQEEGFTIGLAKNGDEAISLLANGWSPDLVILDLMMPKINGREVIRYMKDHSSYKNIPILVTSAGINLRTVTHDAYQPDAMIAKPFDIDTLVAQVNLLLR